MTATLEVLDHGEVVRISFDDLLKYHGTSSIGGVAHGFKVMERGFPLLDGHRPPDRHAIEVETEFPGPGARDAFEMVTRAVTGGRYRVAPALTPNDVPEAPEGRYFFRLRHRGQAVDLVLRPGHVRDDFLALVRKEGRTAEEEERLTALKQEMAERLLALPADAVYDASPA